MRAAPIAGIPIPVTRLVLGTAQLAGRVPLPVACRSARRRATRLLDAAYEAGYRAFDTAGIWQLGGREGVLGDWLAATGVREEVVIIGKGAHPSIPAFRSRMHARAITSDLEWSLRRLRTDYLDLFLLHRDDAQSPSKIWSMFYTGISGRARCARMVVPIGDTTAWKKPCDVLAEEDAPRQRRVVLNMAWRYGGMHPGKDVSASAVLRAPLRARGTARPVYLYSLGRHLPELSATGAVPVADAGRMPLPRMRSGGSASRKWPRTRA